MKTGSADLPLHNGKCPPWLFRRMRPLARAISRIIIEDYGTMELIRRLADPMFFQAFSCMLAFDWHSSGTTTTSCGALKEALSPDLGMVACGGKGKVSRNTPDEIRRFSEYFSISSTRRDVLLDASRMSAKVDSSCIQDNHDLYHHSFFFDEDGNWAVIQQGMNPATRYARRYHWAKTDNFIDEPPSRIAGKETEKCLNLVSGLSRDARKESIDLIRDNPNRLRKYFTGQTTLLDNAFVMPEHHEILRCDMHERDWKLLHDAYELQPNNYEELISLGGMGKKKLRALGLVSKLIHGCELDWRDPVKFSFAHGGKDGFPFPVDRNIYENTIGFLQESLEGADIVSSEKKRALHRLSIVFPAYGSLQKNANQP
jgi:hypothetical protein